MIVVSRRKVGEKERETLEFPTFVEAKQAAFGYKHVSIRCDSCAAVVINNIFCHETGCPESWRDRIVECKECGCDFVPKHRHQSICEDCHV